uniref:NADH-ubiquinone oxidoreductase chain 6 n=1 Tax=Lachesilla sp. LaspMLY TaxID=2597020 RepID=A0A8K1ZG11_9NEOP|nr:NADH dehydrogenase subunit 6 [Lachesilla sp. LaspMLY]
MQYWCLIFFLILTVLFFKTSNPLSMGLLLILQIIFSSIYFCFFLKSSWFFYIFILIFIGGMLILFIYVTSIFPNEKFKISQLMLFKSALLFLLFLILLLLYLYYMSLNLSQMETYMDWSIMDSKASNSTKKIFMSQTYYMYMLMVNYLFFCMIVVIKITNFFQGPLRKMLYV